MKSILLCNAPEQTARVYSEATLDALEAEAGLASRENFTLADLKAAYEAQLDGAFTDIDGAIAFFRRKESVHKCP